MKGVIVVLVACVFAPAAHAACPVTVSRDHGAAPLRVTFRAGCDSAVLRWRFGDGATAEGRTVTHSFRGGRFTPVLRTDAGAQRLDPVTSIALRLVAPRTARYAERVTLRATVVPNLPVTVAGRRFRGGTLTISVTRPLVTAVAAGVAARATIRVRPILDVQLEGSSTVGSPLRVVAVVRPAHAGAAKVKVDGVPTKVVDTTSVRTARIVVISTPNANWAPAWRVVRAHVRAPRLAVGDRGQAVVALERRLRELGYAIRDENGTFDDDDWAAVLAFQKVNGLTPTGAVTPTLWARLERAGPPRARYGGDHIEVDKTRQVLFVVRGGKVILVTHISTGATGNTPLGLWHVYSKVPGWSWVLWYPSYFLRGFAIHGYPDVPAYPASHGCVRVPMWLAPNLYAQMPVGSAIHVYA
jgi:peptidoglycan hydrolase-like protein with peptidoglycan-binding domain